MSKPKAKPARLIVATSDTDADMLYALRPATGISPEFFDSVIGKQALTPIEAGAPVQWESIQ